MTGTRLPWDWYEEPVPDNVHIGPRSWIYSSFAFLHHSSRRPDAVRLGSDSGVYHPTGIVTGPDGRLEVGDFCALAGPLLVTNGTIRIGDYAFVSFGVVIADTFAAVPFDARPAEPGPQTVIGPNVWIGAGATILGGARIGEDAVVGAWAVVAFDVPDGAIVAGNPATVVGSVRG